METDGDRVGVRDVEGDGATGVGDEVTGAGVGVVVDDTVGCMGVRVGVIEGIVVGVGACEEPATTLSTTVAAAEVADAGSERMYVKVVLKGGVPPAELYVNVPSALSITFPISAFVSRMASSVLTSAVSGSKSLSFTPGVWKKIPAVTVYVSSTATGGLLPWRRKPLVR